MILRIYKMQFRFFIFTFIIMHKCYGSFNLIRLVCYFCFIISCLFNWMYNLYSFIFLIWYRKRPNGRLKRKLHWQQWEMKRQCVCLYWYLELDGRFGCSDHCSSFIMYWAKNIVVTNVVMSVIDANSTKNICSERIIS